MEKPATQMSAHQSVLDGLAQKGRLRALLPRRGLDFSSNDYLALAESDQLRDAAAQALARGVPLGAGASRLLRGNHAEHEALETEAAEFFGSEAALYFPTGFAANAAIAAALPRRGDLIVYDRYMHASFRAGLEPSRIAAVDVAHNDVTAIDDTIAKWRAKGGKGRPWIAVETLYSMDGDFAPIADLVAIAARHDAMLILDEAHASGVYGERGRGLGAEWEGTPTVISLHTCGKGLGAAGALICLPRVLRDFMVNRARNFIYSTAPSPLMAAVVRQALRICAGAEQERRRLRNNMALARGLAERHGIAVSGSQIIPVIVGCDRRASVLAGALQKRGYDIRAIRPPTVAEDTARLRISLTLHVDEKDVALMFAALEEAMREL